MSNARKFVSEVKGRIDIYAEIIRTEDKWQLRISVTDNGPGISEEDQTKLFRPFSKLQTHRALNPNGSGLGLHICKLISQTLDGDIEVKSEVGVFTTFTFWITVKDPDESNADLELTSHRSGTEIQLMLTP